MTKNNYFVLMEVGFDYNDEIYFSMRGLGNPLKVFTSKEEADKQAELENMVVFKSLFKDGSIYEYGYNLDEMIDRKVPRAELNSKSGIFMRLFGKNANDWWGDYNCKFLREPTDQEWIQLINCFNFTFYQVIEVEKG